MAFAVDAYATLNLAGNVPLRTPRLADYRPFEFVVFRGASRRVEDVINAVHCRLIVFVCSNQLREHGRSKEKGGGRWSGDRPCPAPGVLRTRPGVGLLGWSKGSGDDKGRVYGAVQGRESEP